MDIPVRKKTKVGTHIRDENPNLVRVACALRGMLDDVIQDVGESPGIRNLLEHAAQNMIIEGVSSQEPGIERKVVERAESVTTCTHSCTHHAKLMDVALWSGLPEEVQEFVFARLPWPLIYQVRILSKGWKQKLMSAATDSQLKRACARAQPKSFALLAPGIWPGSFTVNVFDIPSNRWHTFETSPNYNSKRGEIQGMHASNGGLVCFFESAIKVQEDPSACLCLQPFDSGVETASSSLWHSSAKDHGAIDHGPRDKALQSDCCGPLQRSQTGNLVNVYHSETGQWTKGAGSSSGEVVYGYLYNFNYQSYFNSDRFKPSPCSYSFADGLVHELVTNFPGNYAHESDLVKDHLFRLKDVEPADGLPTHCIEEHQAVHCGASWTPLKEHPFNRLPRTPQHIQPDDMCWFTHFLACMDFFCSLCSTIWKMRIAVSFCGFTNSLERNGVNFQ